MGINFPASPTLNQKYPQPPVAGVPVYTWDGEKWTTVGGSIAAYAPPADAVPLMDATPGLVGTSTEYAREDHVHPTDTSRCQMTAVGEVLAEPTAGCRSMAGWRLVRSLVWVRSTAASSVCCDGWTMQH